LKKFDKSKVDKILVIKPAAIGDVLLSTPVVENLRSDFPDAEIIFLTQKFCKEVLTGNPYITRVLTYDLNLDGGWCIIKNIRKQKYDLILDLFGNPRTALITYLSRAVYKVGFKFRQRKYAYNIKLESRGGEVHNVEFNLDALRALGLEVKTSQPKFYINNVHKEFAEKFFQENNLTGNRVIGVNPCGTWKTKVWYLEKFAELIKMFDDDYRFLVFWGYGDEKVQAQKLRDMTGNNVLIVPQVNLKYLGALMKRCKVFLTNDTGPMHIASVLGVNVAAIFGPTNPRLQGPLNTNSAVIRNEKLDCLGCNLTKIEDCPYEHKCMSGLDASVVYKNLQNFLK
jgi:lipopolysaccharide heptosyltransferase II